MNFLNGSRDFAAGTQVLPAHSFSSCGTETEQVERNSPVENRPAAC